MVPKKADTLRLSETVGKVSPRKRPFFVDTIIISQVAFSRHTANTTCLAEVFLGGSVSRRWIMMREETRLSRIRKDRKQDPMQKNRLWRHPMESCVEKCTGKGMRRRYSQLCCIWHHLAVPPPIHWEAAESITAARQPSFLQILRYEFRMQRRLSNAEEPS